MTAPTDLLGRWALTRTVEDRLAGELREVVGEATLTQTAADLVRWHEGGTMTWSGRSVEVERDLEVRRTYAGWTVHFADGRVFHPWLVGAEVEHACTPDHYRGLIEVEPGRADVPEAPPARWSVRWEARGPHKDYLMRTEHRRTG